MPEKFPSYKAMTIILSSYLTIITLFCIYEVTIIGNPFNDPITPSILWICLVIVSWTFSIKYFQAIRKK